MATPEKVSLWDRWFNRYRKTVYNRGSESWGSRDTCYGVQVGYHEYNRNFVEYLVVDRVTGSERIEKEYLN